MHHLYPSLKGDQLCPLGFHPQTRYPTRCKRCFRDYKEHGARRGGDDVAASSPNLSDGANSRPSSRTWTSTQNLFTQNGSSGSSNDIELKKRPQSWASTPDIDEADDRTRGRQRSGGAEENNVDVTLKLPVPNRRHTTTLDLKEVEQSLSQKTSTQPKPTTSPARNIPDDLVILSTDSLAERVRKMNLLKKQRSLNSRENSRERSVPRKSDDEHSSNSKSESKLPPDRPERSKPNATNADSKLAALPPKKTSSATSSTTAASSTTSTSSAPARTTAATTSTTRPATIATSTLPSVPTKQSSSSSLSSSSSSSNSNSNSTPQSATRSSSSSRSKESEKERASQDVAFMLKIKDTKYGDKRTAHDNMSLTTETTDTTLVGHTDHDLQEEVKMLRTELETMKARAERAERDKSDILLRRLASMETAPNRTAASEALMLQQKVNELKEKLDKVNEEKRRLNTRMKEIENKGGEYDLKRKLNAAEQLCEELMEENQEAKKEILNLQAEMDELQDTYRDDDVKAKTNLQKDLEKTTKNCRILSFKLKKSERKIEILEQEKQNSYNGELAAKVQKLEEELRFSNELTRKLQAEAEELRNPGKRKPPMLGVIGKSTSADAKFTRESLTRGGSQEDPQQLQRDLHDSVERESDLKDQLKFAEEEAESLRKKVARFEDENDSLMMQLKKMAARSRTRKLSPTPHRLAPEVQADRDEGISDEDDPAELRILLELNEQEASILRIKVEDLEKQHNEAKKQVKELQERLHQEANSGKKSSFLSFSSAGNAADKKLKALNDELVELRKALVEKDRTIERLQAETAARNNKGSLDTKRQLDLVEQEAAILRIKVSDLETENEKLTKESKRMQLQSLRKSTSSEKSSTEELNKLKETLAAVEQEKSEISSKLNRILQASEDKLPPRTPKRITDLTPKNHLKKWVEELEDEINEMRVIVLNSSSDKLKSLESEKNTLEVELQKLKQKLSLAEGDILRLKTLAVGSSKNSDLEQKLKKSEEESKKLGTKLKDLEDKIKKQDSQIKQAESTKSAMEQQTKREREKLTALEKDYDKERKEREKLENKISQLETDLGNARKAYEKTKSSLEKELKDLKAKSSKSDSKQVQDLKKQIEDLSSTLAEEAKRYTELNTHWEKLSEETILMRAQLTTEKQNLLTEVSALKQKLSESDQIRIEKTDLAKRLSEAQKKLRELEASNNRSGASEHEKTMLKNKLQEKEQEYNRLRRENEMNIDLVFQLRKDNDDLNSKLSDFNRIEQAQLSINGHSAGLQSEIRALQTKLQGAELQLKSEVASTRLRYEQQVKNLSHELTSMQRQCEKFKKDRDAFKQMLESAQKKIGDLKANTTGRQSRGSMHSSDDDDKSKIAYLDQQIGCLEDQLVEARLEVSKVKTELVSERSANEIKISEMQSKLNEFEEERVIGSGRTKIPGMKTKLELSWQKEREDQQRLLQETSTLARDLRQTLFEVERERDKERLEAKRRLDQLKRSTEEETEEGRKKIAELQCDLLELRDVHAKLRTSNEKLRRERERYEKELIKRRMDADGGDRKVGALLQTVDELVKIAPDLKMVTGGKQTTAGNTLRPEQPNTRRSRSPSPTLSSSQIATVLARLAEASDELRKFQRMSEDENERNRMRRGNLRRAASQENDPHGSQSSVASIASNQRNGPKLSRNSGHNGSLIRKSLSLDHSIQKDQNIWRQDEGSVSSMQSIDSELGGMVRDSSYDSRLDSRLSGGSTQSDIPRGPRKKKKGLMGKLRSFAKSSRNSESEVSIQGSDSDISVASDMRASKKDLRNRLSGMFKRAGSTTRSDSTERVAPEQRPVAVTVVGVPDGPQPREPPPANSLTPRPIRSIAKPPTQSSTTPLTKRRPAK